MSFAKKLANIFRQVRGLWKKIDKVGHKFTIWQHFRRNLISQSKMVVDRNLLISFHWHEILWISRRLKFAEMEFHSFSWELYSQITQRAINNTVLRTAVTLDTMKIFLSLKRVKDLICTRIIYNTWAIILKGKFHSLADSVFSNKKVLIYTNEIMFYYFMPVFNYIAPK